MDALSFAVAAILLVLLPLVGAMAGAAQAFTRAYYRTACILVLASVLMVVFVAILVDNFNHCFTVLAPRPAHCDTRDAVALLVLMSVGVAYLSALGAWLMERRD